jgi:type II secretory pathway pseudopilin PulG
MAGRRARYSQRGAALLIFLILVVTAAMTYLVSNLTPEMLEARRAQKTNAALVQARDALIGYALQYRDQQIATGTLDAMYGYLPLPDFGESVNRNADFSHPCATEGCAKMNATGLSGNGILIGRFPWKTVGTGPLRDGHGECLWYAVSATHRSINPSATIMNWDTLANSPTASPPDILIGSGKPDLSALNQHDRPIAVIFSPDPPFDGGRTQSTDAPECGGNYDSTHYVNPALNNTQTALPVSSGKLFEALRRSSIRTDDPINKPDPPTRSPSFADQVDDMLLQMIPCVQDQIEGNVITANGKINDTCSLMMNSNSPQGYYLHYRDQVMVAKCAACNIVNVDGQTVSGCAGALLLGNQRGTKIPLPTDAQESTLQLRTPVAVSTSNVTLNTAWWANYLEDPNLASFATGSNSYRGPMRLGPVKAARNNLADNSRCAPGGIWSLDASCQTVEQDIVRCIPAGATQRTVSLDLSAIFPGVTSLATYGAANQVLTLGASNAELSSANANAGRLFACSWDSTSHSRGNGFRRYFRFKIKDTGDGFTFAIVDADRNPDIFNRCGAAGRHLGYSGDNGYTDPLVHPKMAIEFDTSVNTGVSRTTQLTYGRNDPNNYHVAIMYWGHPEDSTLVSQLVSGWDDNIHSYPSVNDPSARPSPTNGTNSTHGFPQPYPPLATTELPRLRDSQQVNRDFHVRVEVTPQARSTDDETYKRRAWKIEAWVEPTYAKVITSIVWSRDVDSSTGALLDSGTAIVTAPSHNFGDTNTTQTLMIRSAPAGFNGDYAVTIKDANTFSFSKYPDPGSTTVTGQPVAMKLTDQVSFMRSINQPMSILSPVIKGKNKTGGDYCTTDVDCPSSHSCSGPDSLGNKYCYAGHQPTVYDQQLIYDTDLGGGNYQEAFQNIFLGSTLGVGSNDQVIDITEIHTQWVP